MIIETKNILGPYIRFYRRKLGISQDFLAARLSTNGLKFDRTMISKIENQTRILYDYEILGICNALSISVSDLYKKIT
ncbi:XRE family transcriptional regulator [Clostridium beijerinckii NRRL B-598]|nr:XRE family transcriptional regulator [Clostridium beijerinckii NRRL B-598]